MVGDRWQVSHLPVSLLAMAEGLVVLPSPLLAGMEDWWFVGTLLGPAFQGNFFFLIYLFIYLFIYFYFIYFLFLKVIFFVFFLNISSDLSANIEEPTPLLSRVCACSCAWGAPLPSRSSSSSCASLQLSLKASPFFLFVK